MAKKPETATRIADNKKAAYNYFFEERFEAGMALEGWEVKSLREGKVQLTDGYVVIRDGELFLIGCQINPLQVGIHPRDPGRGAHQEAADAQGKIQPPDRQDRAEGLHAGPAQPALESGQGECEIALAKGKPRRQAQHDQGPRRQARSRAGHEEPQRGKRCGLAASALQWRVPDRATAPPPGRDSPRMHLLLRKVAVVLATTLALCSCASQQPAANPAHTRMADGVLTDAKGMTLYTFDIATWTGSGVSACRDRCARKWLPFPWRSPARRRPAAT